MRALKDSLAASLNARIVSEEVGTIARSKLPVPASLQSWSLRRRMYYSAMLTPEPPISFGMSLIFGNPSFIRSFVSS